MVSHAGSSRRGSYTTQFLRDSRELSRYKRSFLEPASWRWHTGYLKYVKYIHECNPPRGVQHEKLPRAQLTPIHIQRVLGRRCDGGATLSRKGLLAAVEEHAGYIPWRICSKADVPPGLGWVATMKSGGRCTLDRL